MMHMFERASNLWPTSLAILLALMGCNKAAEQAPTPAAQQAALTQDKQDKQQEPRTEVPPAKPAEPPPQAAAPKPNGPSSDFIGYPKEGWSKLKLHDTLPLCVFANTVARYEAKFIDQVKRQTLKANQSVVFGAFGPYCINEACDDLPSLQCVVRREGNTLTVHARYIGYHKDGTTCTDDCREVMAGCETPELERGKYTVKYGDKTYKLKIPSVMRSPCFKTE